MKRPLLALALLVCAVPSFAQYDIRKELASDEQWMLDVVLSDDARADAYQKDAVAAAGAADKTPYVMRWRKRVIDFAKSHKNYLDTHDINKDAPNVQKMVSDYEFAVTSYWLNRQPRQRQDEVRAQVDKGNSWLGLARGTVEDGVRGGRKTASADLGTYLASAPVKQAIAYREPVAAKPKPKVPEKALEQAEKAAGQDTASAGKTTPEEVKGEADKAYTGGDSKPESDAVVAGTPGEWRTYTPNLTLSPSGEGGGSEPLFSVKAPPSPIIDQNQQAKPKTVWSLVKAFGPAVILGVIGAILFGAVMGPVGVVLGAVFGAAVGYNVGKDIP